MANYYFSAKNISRRGRTSLTGTAGYICGRTLHDSYHDSIYRYSRADVLYRRIFLPRAAPESFYDLQYFCDKLEEAESRRDARTARYFIGSLPNELPEHELSRIVREYVETNFVACGLGAIAAIHTGVNEADPVKNNPHVHIIVSTRTVGPEGVGKEKNREHNRREYVIIWREKWALVQNRAYERNGINIRVSHESLEAQNIRDREPVKYLDRLAWQRKQREALDRQRKIETQLPR